MDPVFILIASAFIAWVFASAAWLKLQSPAQMVTIINNYRVLPFTANRLFVIGVAVSESIIALSMLLSDSRQWGALFAVCLLGVYGVAIGVNLWIGRTHIDCGCSGPTAGNYDGQVIRASMLWRNGSLILVALFAMSGFSDRLLQWEDYAVVVLATAFTILLYLIVEQLTSNYQRLQKLN